MKKALITGVTGQDGAYLAQLLVSKGYTVDGGLRRNSQDELYRLKVLGIENEVNIVTLDLTDSYNVAEVVGSGGYSEIYNLAAQSFVGSSWDLPNQTTAVNAQGALNLLDCTKRFSRDTKFYQASTSEMFGKIQEPLQSESTPFYPRSPYGVAKLFAHWMTVNYRESHNIHASAGILFNHESPLRGEEFVTKKITTQLAEIKHSLREVLYLGNLDAKRDWGYAKEYVEAMWLMLQQDTPDDYVIATGSTTRVKDFVDSAANALGFDLVWEGDGLDQAAYQKSNGRKVVAVAPEFFRPAEVDVLIGNPDKARTKLGWHSATNVSELAAKMAEFDDERVHRRVQ